MRCAPRLAGRCVCHFTIRLPGRQVGDTSRHSLPHREDTCVEPGVRMPRENGRHGIVWNPTGIKVFGTPVGSAAFVQEVVNKVELWNAIPSVPDLQAAWQILLQCAGPRCHHLRTLPPLQSEDYARSHDDGMERVTRILVGISSEQQEVAAALNIASLPMRWVGVEKSHPNGTSSLLGLVGRRVTGGGPETP